MGDPKSFLAEVDAWQPGQPTHQVGRLRHAVGVGQHDVVASAPDVGSDAAVQSFQRTEACVRAWGQPSLSEPCVEETLHWRKPIHVALLRLGSKVDVGGGERAQPVEVYLMCFGELQAELV